MTQTGSKRYLVFAGSFHQSRKWAHEQGLQYRTDYIHVTDETTLMGRRPDQWEFVMVGDCWNRPDYERVMFHAKGRGFLD